MISILKYDRLFRLLKERGMKKTDLLEVISSKTLSRLTSNKSVTTRTIDHICIFLHCRIEDIMEYVPDD